MSDHAEDVKHLAADGVLAYPTETVWGLGADATRPAAVERLLAFKGQRAGAPISVLVPDAAALAEWGAHPGAVAQRLIEAFWPGPLTLVLRADGAFAPGIAREDGSVGFRCSPHPVAGALARAAREQGLGPLTATSCNRSGEPPARNRAEAAEVCAGGSACEAPRRTDVSACEAPRLTAAVEPDASGEPPSSVVDASGEKPKLLREGALSAAALSEAAGPGVLF